MSLFSSLFMKFIHVVAFATSYGFTVIPTRLHPNGFPLITANIGDGESHLYELSIGAFSRSFLTHADFDCATIVTFNTTRPDVGNISLTANRHPVTLVDDAVDNAGWIAIGPGSDLARSFGSVDYTGTEIVLGSFEDFFLTEQCHNSFIEIPTRMEMIDGYAEIPKLFSTISFKILNTQSTALVIYEPIATVLHGPAAYFDAIFEITAKTSTTASGESAYFEDCDRVRKLLPLVQFVYFGDSLTTAQGISPFQYTRKVSGNVCELLISRDPDPSPRPWILFNPMRIPGIKIRAGADKIVLCI